jgi:ribosomal protein S18 acetylase RimI-like enzyme
MNITPIEEYNFEEGTLTLYRGLSTSHYIQMTEAANGDEQVRQFTRDSVRFASQTYSQFIATRQVYSLANPVDSQLAGVVWFGSKSRQAGDEAYSHDLAVRTYKPYRGRGLAGPLIQAAITDLSSREVVGGVWLEAHADNHAAIKVYRNLGFVALDQDQTKRQIFGLKLPD